MFSRIFKSSSPTTSSSSDPNALLKSNETSSLTSERCSTKGKHRWTIHHFRHTIEKTVPNTYIQSAVFHCLGKDMDSAQRRFAFDIWLMPKSTTQVDSIGVYLCNRSTEELNVNYSFHLEKADGSLLKHGPRTTAEVQLAPDGSRGFATAFNWPELDKLIGGSSIVVLVCDLEIFFPSRRSDLSSLLTKIRAGLSSSKIETDLAKMIGNPVFSDVCLSCEGQSFPCHKVVLAARSDVFQAMFAHSECAESVSNVVKIEDANPVVLMAFIKYLYSDEMDLAKESYPQQLLALSDKYNVGSLKLKMEYVLCRTIGLLNVVELALLAHLHEANTLMKMTLEFIASHLEEVSSSAEWKRVMEANPKLMGKVLSVVARKK